MYVQVSEWFMLLQSTGLPTERVVVDVSLEDPTSLYAFPDEFQGPSGSRNTGSVSS